ncbi:MAG: [protein-PII] uridylyltransferase [Alphaproteobacteria bacterium]|nr:[protein-PII] uridylyltransferase [Alphaproteobacteria bacterium]
MTGPIAIKHVAHIPASTRTQVRDALGVVPSEIVAQLGEALAHSAPNQRTIALKAIHQGWLDGMRQAQEQHHEALSLCKALSDRIDVLIGQLAAELLHKNQHNHVRVSMIALGGYGRGELYPHSDIDILILTEGHDNIAETLKPALEKLLYPLWDIGLTVGHSIQSPKSALALAKTDHTYATALLETRLLYGDPALYSNFSGTRDTLFHPPQNRFGTRFVRAKHDERLHRHQQHGDHRSMLEPNLKEGIGSLRDVQHIRWISQALCGKPDPAQAGLLQPTQHNLLKRAYRQLATIRLALHFELDGKDNRLLMHHQMHIAERLGFRQHRTLRPIERLMKLFFLTRAQVELLDSIVTTRLITRGILPDPKPRRQPHLPQPYIWYENHLARTQNFQSAEDVLEFLLLLKQFHARPSAGTLEMLMRAKRLFVAITPDNPAAKPARALLRRILCETTTHETFTQIAGLLNRLGILGRMLPDFRHVQGLTQLDGYHAWTVDHHTLRVLAHLHTMAEANQESPHIVIDALLLKNAAPAELFFSALLHDIAKGHGGSHAERGAVCAEKLAPQFGFSPEQTATIVWLVRYHLMLSDLALHRDILDAGTAETLLNSTPDARHLDLLYCLTAADIRGVAPNSWTAWKATVIARLYERAQELMKLTPSATDRNEKKTTAISILRAALPDMPTRAFAHHIQHCSGEYLLSTTLPLQIEHAKMMASTGNIAKRESCITLLPDPEDAIVRLVLYTGDYTGLIAHAVGVLTESGYSIVTLKTFPYGENRSLMTVWFHNQGKALLETRRLESLKKRLSTAIRHRYINFDNQQPAEQSSLARTITSKVTFDNTVSRRATVIEVQTYNRTGLLFDLALALIKSRVSIHAAKIDTVGQRAMDVFYVCDRFGLKIYDPTYLENIHTNIKARIS